MYVSPQEQLLNSRLKDSRDEQTTIAMYESHPDGDPQGLASGRDQFCDVGLINQRLVDESTASGEVPSPTVEVVKLLSKTKINPDDRGDSGYSSGPPSRHNSEGEVSKDATATISEGRSKTPRSNGSMSTSSEGFCDSPTEIDDTTPVVSDDTSKLATMLTDAMFSQLDGTSDSPMLDNDAASVKSNNSTETVKWVGDTKSPKPEGSSSSSKKMDNTATMQSRDIPEPPESMNEAAFDSSVDSSMAVCLATDTSPKSPNSTKSDGSSKTIKRVRSIESYDGAHQSRSSKKRGRPSLKRSKGNMKIPEVYADPGKSDCDSGVEDDPESSRCFWDPNQGQGQLVCPAKTSMIHNEWTYQWYVKGLEGSRCRWGAGSGVNFVVGNDAVPLRQTFDEELLMEGPSGDALGDLYGA